METSLLFSLLHKGILQKWREEEENKESIFTQKKRKAWEALQSAWSDDDLQAVKAYTLAVEDNMDHIQYILQEKILHLGIQIGMEWEKAFRENDLSIL